MSKKKLIVFCLFFLLIRSAEGSDIHLVTVNNHRENSDSRRYDYSHERIRELITWEDDSVSGYDFSYCIIDKARLDCLSDISNCSFAHARFLAGNVSVYKDCNFTQAWFGPKCYVSIPPENLIQTKNFHLKRLDFVLLGVSLHNVDCSSFDISNQFIVRDFEGACFNDTYFHDVWIASIPKELLKQTRNYKEGIFYKIKFIPDRHITNVKNTFQNLDISKKEFIECSIVNFSMKNAIMEDTVFIDTYISSDLTLEQIKQTWNYKSGRMDLLKLPEGLQKQVDAELEKEGRRVKTDVEKEFTGK
ncbi:MAG: hypothetical protein Q4C96_07195 [Planctomycetia bacterium]|nr:hypothetical protein [Planctomycetia bacterium]